MFHTKEWRLSEGIRENQSYNIFFSVLDFSVEIGAIIFSVFMIRHN